MKALAKVPVLILMTSFTLLAQQPKTVQRRAALGGALSGRIFAVTRGGDLKPAILADVYLFFEVSIHADGTVIDVGGSDTAGDTYMKKVNEGMEAELEKMKQEDWSDHIRCLNDLLVYQDAIVKTLQSVSEKEQWQVVTGQTDEDGYFKLSVPRQGSYYLVVKGQAGANDAEWEQEGVRVFTGKVTELKLGSPKQACLKADDE